MISKDGVVVVTGAGRGLGAAVAELLVENGFSVALMSRTLSDLNDVRERLTPRLKAGRNIEIYCVDLCKGAEVRKVIADLSAKYPEGVVGLLNNAATWTGGKAVLDLTRDDLQESLDLNFYSAFNCITETLKNWESRKKPLSIVNVGATSSKRGGKRSFAFALAKSSLRILSQSLARELGPEGVHVAHLVVDGLIDNPRTRKLNPQTPDHKYIQMNSLAHEILRVMLQTKDCWTFEWDVRTSTCDW